MAKGPQPGLFNFGNSSIIVDEAVQAVLDRVIIQENNSTPYILPSPPQSTEIDTGFDPAGCGPNCQLTFSLFLYTGTPPAETNYALFESVSAQVLAANPDVRIARASEFPGVAGDVDVVFWQDGVTNTIHFEYDVDGGGKTIAAAAITILGDVLEEDTP